MSDNLNSIEGIYAMSLKFGTASLNFVTQLYTASDQQKSSMIGSLRPVRHASGEIQSHTVCTQSYDSFKMYTSYRRISFVDVDRSSRVFSAIRLVQLILPSSITIIGLARSVGSYGRIIVGALILMSKYTLLCSKFPWASSAR